MTIKNRGINTYTVNDGTVSRKTFINHIYDRYNVNLGDPIEKVIQKMIKRKSIDQFDSVREFMKQMTNKSTSFEIEKLNAKHRFVLYHLAIYYNYSWVTTKLEQWDSFGYDYSKYVMPGQVYEYGYLRKHRVHNLENYHVVDADKGLYKLKHDAQVYKHGVTKDTKTLRFDCKTS